MSKANFGAMMRTFLGMGPKELSTAARIELLFDTSGDAIVFDLVQEGEQNYFTTVQAIWIENQDNTATFYLSVDGGTKQTVICPPQSQGMFPIIGGANAKFSAWTATPSILVPIVLLNVPQPYYVVTIPAA